MVHEFQPRPLPTFDEYTQAVRSVQQKMDTVGLDAKQYLMGVGINTESGKSFARSAVAMANAVELIDPNTGDYADVERRRGRALYLGAMAGYAMLYEIYNVSLPSSEMLTFLPPLVVDMRPGDAAHNINSLHSAILTTGSEGRRQLGGPANSHLALWSERTVAVPEHRPTFLAATGLITLAGIEMQTKRIQQFEQEQIQEYINSSPDFDWDAALAELKENGE